MGWAAAGSLYNVGQPAPTLDHLKYGFVSPLDLKFHVDALDRRRKIAESPL